MRNLVLNYALSQFKFLRFYPEIKNVKSNTIGVLVCSFYAFCWVFNILGMFVEFNGLDSIVQAMISLSSAHQVGDAPNIEVLNEINSNVLF